MVLVAPYIHGNRRAAEFGRLGHAVRHPLRRYRDAAEVRHSSVDGLPVRFAVPPAACDGTETPLYSWRLFAWWPGAGGYRDRMSAAGAGAEKDLIFRPEAIARCSGLSRVIPAIDHFQLVTTDEVARRVAGWLAATLNPIRRP
jgi:hypothetical protein